MSYYCDTYDCEYLYEESPILMPNEDIYAFLDAMYIISLTLLGGLAVTQIGLLGYTLYRSTNLISKISTKQDKLDEPEDHKIKIIRGVPGVGKRNYVYYLESGLNRKFIICDWNNYFINEDGKYYFNGKETSKAESHCMTEFLNAIDSDIKRIYVIGNFNEKWQYSNYITIGKLFKYKVEITELKCKNEEQLKYFNSRSSHNIPYSKSLKVYKSWESDKNEYKRTPYIDPDKLLQLTCLINSSENKSESNSIDNKNSNTLPHNKTFDSPENREISFISESDILNLKKNILKSYQEINDVKVFKKNKITVEDTNAVTIVEDDITVIALEDRNYNNSPINIEQTYVL
jgi:hypothetical protein